jgi:uncharacterized protein YjiS (DUF1127 family)
MTTASLTERAMTQQPLIGDAPVPALPRTTDDAASRLVALATRLVTWRRRAQQARDFRGFDRHQLRDLGLNHFDQW